MTTFNELYKEMGELLLKYPEIGDLEMCACGVDSRLNIFRQEPDGPVTGVSLEDASHMEGHISYVRDLVKTLGVSLSSQHMEYLIQMCMEEASEKEMEDFAKQYSLSGLEKLLVFKSDEPNIEVYYSTSSNKFQIGDFSSSNAGEISEHIKETYQAEIPWVEFVAGYFKEEFGVNPELTLYYIQKYENLVERAIKKADVIYDEDKVPVEERDYGEDIAAEELNSNHDEVVGHYLGYYMENPLKGWLENTEGDDLSSQGKKVQKTLQNMFGKRRERGINIPLKEKIDVAKEKTTSSKKNVTREFNSINRNGYPERV